MAKIPLAIAASILAAKVMSMAIPIIFIGFRTASCWSLDMTRLRFDFAF
jgi:hypothetical protein